MVIINTTFNKKWRWVTGPLRMLPDFIIPGEAKCGTTSFYGCLTQHPWIRPADEKEPHNFLTYGGSPLFCRMHYPLRIHKPWAALAGRRCLTGEATANYLASADAARNVAALVPGVKLIVLLRNPITRAFSDYQMMRAGGWEQQDFDQGVAAHLTWLQDQHLEPLVRYARLAGEGFLRFILRGVYAEHIEAWRRSFPAEQFLFVKSEDFFRDPQNVLQTAFRFLGVKDFVLPEFSVRKKGAYASNMTRRTRDLLGAFYRPYNERLYRLIGRDLGWETEWEQLPVRDEGPGAP